MFDSARFIYPEILLFWEGNSITKTMLQADFQAVLDGYAGIPQYANKDICAAYVQLNAQHIIYASIFFTICFDQEGFPEGSWNLPLRNMIAFAGRGPDLGGGHVRWVSQHNCTQVKYKDFLWSPQSKEQAEFYFQQLQSEVNAFCKRHKMIAQSVATATEEDEFPILSAESDVVEEEEDVAVDAHWEAEKTAYSRLIASQEQLIKHLEKDKINLQQEVTELLMKQHSVADKDNRLYLENQELIKSNQQIYEKLEKNQQDLVSERDLVLRLKQENDLLKNDDVVERLQSKIVWKEKEFLQEKESLKTDFLHILQSAGVNFLVFHEGLGNLSIPAEDIPRYLQDSIAYAAEKCFVEVEQYRAWLIHYQAPRCQVAIGEDMCNARLIKVDSPARFLLGQSDRCARHQTADFSIDKVLKFKT